MLNFRSDILNDGDEVKITLWEMTLYEFLTKKFNNSLIEVLAIGNQIVDYEMNADGKRISLYFVMG